MPALPMAATQASLMTPAGRVVTARGSGSSGYWPEETFVHVLNLRRGWAFCAGLPEVTWAALRATRLSPFPRRAVSLRVDARQGLVAVMDTESLEVERMGRVNLGAVEGANVGRDEPGRRDARRPRLRTTPAVRDDGVSDIGRLLSAPGRTRTGRPSTARLCSRRVAAIDLDHLSTGDVVASVPTPGLAPIVSLDPLPD